VPKAASTTGGKKAAINQWCQRLQQQIVAKLVETKIAGTGAGKSCTLATNSSNSKWHCQKQWHHVGDSTVSSDSNHNKMKISSRQQSTGGDNSGNSQPVAKAEKWQQSTSGGKRSSNSHLAS